MFHERIKEGRIMNTFFDEKSHLKNEFKKKLKKNMHFSNSGRMGGIQIIIQNLAKPIPQKVIHRLSTSYPQVIHRLSTGKEVKKCIDKDH